MRAAVVAATLALIVGAGVASPLLLRNLALFHTPMYSDIAAFGLWAYVDKVSFATSLVHPPPVLPWVLAHVPQVLAHMAHSVVVFFTSALPDEIVGHAFWMLPLAAGVLLSLRPTGLAVRLVLPRRRSSSSWRSTGMRGTSQLDSAVVPAGRFGRAGPGPRRGRSRWIGPVRARSLLAAATCWSWGSGLRRARTLRPTARDRRRAQGSGVPAMHSRPTRRCSRSPRLLVGSPRARASTW
jgi:hypothetical protein